MSVAYRTGQALRRTALQAIPTIFGIIVLCFLLPFAIAAIFFISGATGFSVYAVAYRDGVRKIAMQ